MIAHSPAAVVRAAVAAFAILAGGMGAQAQQSSANAVALAKEIILLKGVATMYDPIVTTTIERARGTFMQINPMVGKDLNEVAVKLRTEMSTRASELNNEVAKLYASHFTEPELKEALAFYKTPLGRKIISEEPAILDESVALVTEWQKKFADEVMGKFRGEMRKRGHDL